MCPELKKVQASHEARKKKDENIMRLSSGFLVLSIWNLSYMMGTIYMQIVPSILAFLVFNELKGLKRSESKDR